MEKITSLPDFFAIKNISWSPNQLWDRYISWLNLHKNDEEKIQGIVGNFYYSYNNITKEVGYSSNLPEGCTLISLKEWEELEKSEKPLFRKLAFKGFEKSHLGIECRGEVFSINKIYNKYGNWTVNSKPKLCSSDGYHYCNKLKDINHFYKFSKKENVFGIIEILGAYSEDEIKGVTSSFKILRLLTEQEVISYTKDSDLDCSELLKLELDPEYKTQFEFNKKVKEAVKIKLEEYSKNELEIEKEKTSKMAKSMKLDLIRRFQMQYPHTQIGGSVGLFLHGVKLDRFAHRINDFDIITPYYTKFENLHGDGLENIEIIENSSEGRSGNDFKECITIKGIKADIRIDNTQKYDIIEFEGFKYKVSVLEAIWAAKLRYNNHKHISDLKEAMGIL